ncbi:hypothetical protein L218DRAFT_934513 [Marasmius fiardii PR-910]|nr:hypothetical protein L218DRAFT_934513 [Marasmius fiardii PR-910]
MYYPQVQASQNELWQHTLYAPHNPHNVNPAISSNAIHGHPIHPQQHVLSPPLTQHWQQQLLKYESSRSSRSPHHRAKINMLASRSVPKAAIPITNPNAAKPPPPSAAESTTPDVNHPSSTVAPIAEAEAPRPSNQQKPPENNWMSLDMGGVQIKSLPKTSSLWSFKFLVTLYLNHNSLSSIPSEIAQLRHLELLDLTANQLSTLPPELGMLTSLKECYIFDNHIVTLPHELGTLHQLQTLGVEGNPLDPQLKSLIQEKGTQHLISYLRDSCPVPAPPPAREHRDLLSPSERASLDAEVISVLCYNILCSKYATERLYGYTPQWALDWDYRKELILTEVMNYNCDFLCLQEVDVAQYDGFFLTHLGKAGYNGVHFPKSRYKTMVGESEEKRRLVDGCATFYKRDRWILVSEHLVEFSRLAMGRTDFKKTEDMFNRVLGKDTIATVCLMESRETGTRVLVANIHVHWDPRFRDVKLVQVALLLDELEGLAEDLARLPVRLTNEEPLEEGDSSDMKPRKPRTAPPTYTSPSQIPIIIAGDFNSVPSSGVYEFLSSGQLAKDHPDFMGHMYGRYTSEGLKHSFGLRSAYNVVPGLYQPPTPPEVKLTPNGHPRPTKDTSGVGGNAGHGELLTMTNYTPSFQGVIDYIWYSVGNLGVNAVLGGVDARYLEKVVGFPNAHFPADHICLAAEFRVKPPKDTNAKTPLLPHTPSQ